MFENVSKMAAILSQPQSVDSSAAYTALPSAAYMHYWTG